MKTIIVSSLIFIGFSMGVSAQSSDKKLDQVELMKQFVGTWKVEYAEDSSLVWEVIPMGEGYKEKLHYQAKGETYSTAVGIIGFTWENMGITRYVLWPNGQVARLRGGFKTGTNLYWERYTVYENKVLASYVYDIISLDKIILTYTFKGSEETWDNAEVQKYSFERVKK